MSFTDAQGAERKIDWALANAAESRQLLGKYAQIKDQLQAPFLIAYAAKTAGRRRRRQRSDEAEEVAQEEGVNETIAAAPGTAAEAKPAQAHRAASARIRSRRRRRARCSST